MIIRFKWLKNLLHPRVCIYQVWVGCGFCNWWYGYGAVKLVAHSSLGWCYGFGHIVVRLFVLVWFLKRNVFSFIGNDEQDSFSGC